MSTDDAITDDDRKHSIAAAIGGFLAGLITFSMGGGIIFAFIAFLMYNYHLTRKQKLQQSMSEGSDTILQLERE